MSGTNTTQAGSDWLDEILNEFATDIETDLDAKIVYTRKEIEQHHQSELEAAVLRGQIAELHKLAKEHADVCGAVYGKPSRDDCTLPQQLLVRIATLRAELAAKSSKGPGQGNAADFPRHYMPAA